MAKRPKEKKSVTWHEDDFETWFKKHQALPPNSEPLLVVSAHKPLRRQVDVIALDAEGGLVILEVKNEASTRKAVGQALEYLSQYAQVGVDEIADEFNHPKGMSLIDAFRERFGKELAKLSSRRRVFLIAPRFDVPSGVCLQYLSKLFEHGHVSFGAIEVQKEGEGFTITPYKPPRLEHSQNLGGKFGVTARGRIYHVLHASPPVLWNVGKQLGDGKLRLPSSQTVIRKLLRPIRRDLIPMDMPNCDLSLSGTYWTRKKSAEYWAKFIGVVGENAVAGNGSKYAFFAQFKDGSFQGYRKRPLTSFHRDWMRTEVVLPESSWLNIVEASKQREAGKHR